MSEAFGNKGIDKQKQIEQKETSLEQKLDFLKLSGKENDYSNFIKFLKTKSNTKEYKQILEGLENPDYTDDILDYIENYGYPIGKEFNKFIKDYFDIDKKEEIEDKKEEKEDKKEEIEDKTDNAEYEKRVVNNKKIEKIKNREKLKNKIEKNFQKLDETSSKYLSESGNILNEIKGGGDFKKILNNFVNLKRKFDNFDFNSLNKQEEAIKILNDFNEKLEKSKEFIHSFLISKGQQLFREIASPKNNLSDKEKEELYNSTRDFVIDSFPDIKIPEFKLYKGEWTDNENGNPTKILEDVEGNLSDNMVSVDLDHIPPKYDLGRIDSDYKFTNKLDEEYISDLTGEYLDEVKAFQEAGKNLGIVGKGYSKFKGDIQKLWKENSRDIQSGNFSGFKEGLNAYLNSFKISVRQNLEKIYNNNLDIPDELKLTSTDITELGNIQNPNDLRQKFTDFEQKYKALQNYLISGPKNAYEKYKNKLQQEVIEDTIDTKEQQKQVLEFLHKTGFDLIPQEITNQLIKEYQFNVYDIPGLKLNPERLDLVNGMFGEEPNEGGVEKTQWKENLVKFLNKLIYGEINPKNSPLNPNDFIGVMGASINPTELQSIFEKNKIKSGSMWNINNMKKNLKKEKNID